MRKVWVKRPGASATLVQVNDGDLVDDLREMILKKYANSLGRTVDSPDISMHISPRPAGDAARTLRLLGPDEDVCRTVDRYYPDQQRVDDALIIDVRPPDRRIVFSPRMCSVSMRPDDLAPVEPAGDYFPPMGVVPEVGGIDAQTRTLSVLNAGQATPLLSPAATRRARPPINRQHTTSPGRLMQQTTQTSRRVDSDSDAQQSDDAPAPPPLPSPPGTEAPNKSGPPTPMATTGQQTPGPRPSRRSKTQRPVPSAVSTILDVSVPPISVLLVEDNNINLRILEGLMKRLKVRWQTAVNGQLAVEKWKKGGFHLVLMDIQMPVMNGLQATKEIRRLERINGIGAFSKPQPTANGAADEQGKGGDKDILPKGDGLFKSPVTIVALTASNLQSDRHEALAAGCNDFLTKPVNFVWLERKVKEWGCMQALIDIDGWRRWKDFASKRESAL
ncbi:CheY-like protein [Piedraia hortae CBS 480.64]|uniref:CheY-like protein n=1 Tax=Piedraia hortae CBS 480.64 TaxID=1314780 RepID=A0A6A7BV55_9PEZI|nr:CheY-like protein [Piedraia hortae CBS 480.64]